MTPDEMLTMCLRDQVVRAPGVDAVDIGVGRKGGYEVIVYRPGAGRSCVARGAPTEAAAMRDVLGQMGIEPIEDPAEYLPDPWGGVTPEEVRGVVAGLVDSLRWYWDGDIELTTPHNRILHGDLLLARIPGGES